MTIVKLRGIDVSETRRARHAHTLARSLVGPRAERKVARRVTRRLCVDSYGLRRERERFLSFVFTQIASVHPVAFACVLPAPIYFSILAQLAVLATLLSSSYRRYLLTGCPYDRSWLRREHWLDCIDNASPSHTTLGQRSTLFRSAHSLGPSTSSARRSRLEYTLRLSSSIHSAKNTRRIRPSLLRVSTTTSSD